MPTPRPSNLKPAKIRDAFKQDLSAAWAYSRKQHPDHTPYAFVLYGVEGGPIPLLGPHVLTEESLTQSAKRYVEQGHHESLDDARKALRYSVADSPHFADLQDHVPTVDALMEAKAESLDEDAGFLLLVKAGVQALSDLDAQGLFGTGTDRERLLLTVIFADSEKDWTTPAAKRLNPKVTFKRFQKETKIEGRFASCDSVTVSPDGNCLYSSGSRQNPEGKPGKNEFISEVVAYDLRFDRLVRRWTFDMPAYGDSARALACAFKDDSLLVLRSKYSSTECQTLLMRFGPDKNEPLQEERLQGEPGFFALSPDGSRIAVAMHDKTLHLLDGDLRPLNCRQMDVKPYHLRFLKSGDLLVATDSALHCLDPDTFASHVAVPGAAFQITTDDNEQLLAVSRYFAVSGPERDHPTEFGVELYRLPSFERLRSVLISGHQSVDATLSPDGRLLALEAREIGKHRTLIAVFDTESGREVARRRTEYSRVFAFLRDSRTLAIGVSDYIKSEPIIVWPIPNL